MSDPPVQLKRRKLHKHATPSEPRALPAAAARSASEEEIHIQPMQEFALDHPHTNLDRTCENAMAKLDVAKALVSSGTKRAMHKNEAHAIMAEQQAQLLASLSTHKKDLTPIESRHLHYDASQAVPLEMELIQRAMHALYPPDYTGGGVMRSHLEQSALLRNKKLFLPVYTAQHESNLMRVQAGTFVLPNRGPRTFPPCFYGIHCVGRTKFEIPGLTEPVTFTRAMTADEYAALLHDNTQPMGQSPCILCGRFTLLHTASLMRLGLRPNHEIKKAEPDAVYQLWRNKEDEPGGYFRRYVCHPDPGEVVIDPMASYHPSLLHATFEPTLRIWSVHQDQTIWRPAPLLPRDQTGEPVQNF